MSRTYIFLMILIGVMIIPTVALGQIRGFPLGVPYGPYGPYMQGSAEPPFIFFNETFDQAWYWDPYMRRFVWVPIFPRWRGQGYGYNPPGVAYNPPSPKEEAAAPAPSATPGGAAAKMAVGLAVRPIPSRTNPKIVAEAGGKTVTYQIAPMAVILRGQLGGPGVEVPLGSVRPGDKLILQLNDAGSVITLRAQYKMMAGKVKAVAGSTIMLENGDTIKASPQTKILIQGNQACCALDVSVGDMVIASVSPVTGVADVVQVQSPATPPTSTGTGETAPTTAPAAEEDQISLNTLGPLRAGDVLVVHFKAEPAGQAWFTVPGAAANIVMTEQEPGTYSGRYTVKQGDIIVAQPVKVTFQAKSGESYTKESSRLITARTVAGYLPRITSPRQGEEIESPVVVQGVAQPGALVRVVIEFRRVIQTVMPITGTTAIQDVRADSSGRWQTPPLAAVMPFSDSEPQMPLGIGDIGKAFRLPEEAPTVYTITAITIGPNGQEKSAYSIDVTKKSGVALEG